MRTVFQAELQQIGEDLVEISDLVRAALIRASESLFEADVELAEEVISDDARIDLRQTQLDERAIDLLALQAPVASDLRRIVAALRMSASLERMGDLARHLSQTARLRYPESVIPEPLLGTFREMADLDLRIVEAVTRLLTSQDLADADTIHTAKARLNELHASVFGSVAEGGWSPETTVDIALVSRYLERFGDHGVAVARKVAYLVTGEWDAGRDLPSAP